MGVLRRGQRVEVSLRGRWQLGLVEDSRTVLVGADALEEHCVRFDSGCEWLCMQRTDYRFDGGAAVRLHRQSQRQSSS